MSKKRRKYASDFKKESVEYLIRSKKSATDVAKELGIRQDLLSRWKRELNKHETKAFPGNGNPIEKELFQLRKQLAEAEEEKEILKKALAIFSTVKK